MNMQHLGHKTSNNLLRNVADMFTICNIYMCMYLQAFLYITNYTGQPKKEYDQAGPRRLCRKRPHARSTKPK